VQLAERLIEKHSDIELRKKRMKKSINEYENLKRSMIRNRQILVPSRLPKRSISYNNTN
jgi:uncharacterized protein VirK/YbjX